MSIAVYLRWSTSKQDGEMQRREIDAWLAERAKGEEVLWYRDEGRSGRSNTRPGWLRLMNDAEAGLFDRVVVWHLDRVGREVNSSAYWMARLAYMGIEVVSLKQQATGDPLIDSIYQAIVRAQAEQESRTKSQRAKASWPKRRESHGLKGTGGEYNPKAKSGRRKTTPAQEKIIARRVRLGESPSRIAKEFGLARRTVYRIASRASLEL